MPHDTNPDRNTIRPPVPALPETREGAGAGSTPTPTPPPSVPPSLCPSVPSAHSVSSALHLSVSALTPSDRQLLAALFDPNSDLLAAAAALGYDEMDLIDWFIQPHIRRVIESQRRLRHLRREIRNESIAREALDILRQIAHESDDPAERRRAATTALRAITESNRPRPSRGAVTRRNSVPSASPSPLRRSDAEPPTGPVRPSSASPSDLPRAVRTFGGSLPPSPISDPGAEPTDAHSAETPPPSPTLSPAASSQLALEPFGPPAISPAHFSICSPDTWYFHPIARTDTG